MDEMIERVAKAIYYTDPMHDQETDADGRPSGRPYVLPYDSEGVDDEIRTLCQETAWAVIDAMREPTTAMVAAAERIGGYNGDGHVRIFTAMIDAALSDQPPSGG